MLFVSSATAQTKGKQCKFWIFCPSSLIICSNNQQYQLLEDSKGDVGGVIFIKNKRGCWEPKSQNQPIKEEKASWFRKIFVFNAVKPKP